MSLTSSACFRVVGERERVRWFQLDSVEVRNLVEGGKVRSDG